MKEGQIDNLIHYLWTQYQTDNNDFNTVITKLLDDLRQQLMGMKD